MAKVKREIDKDLMFQRIMPSADIAVKRPEAEIPQPIIEKDTNINQIIGHHTAYPNKQQTHIINVVEKAVSDSLDSVLERFKCCKCDRCKKDIIALALNSIQPKYIVALVDRPIPDYYLSQRTAEITTAIVRAVIKVKSDPRH